MRISDWSSDVCSSDLQAAQLEAGPGGIVRLLHQRVVAGAEHDLIEALLANDIELAVAGDGHARLADDRAAIVGPRLHDLTGRRVDLQDAAGVVAAVFDGEEEAGVRALAEGQALEVGEHRAILVGDVDRKSTRLNSSH